MDCLKRWDMEHLLFTLQNGADVKWVDGAKAIFKVSTNVVSTVYTQVRTSGFLFALRCLFLLVYCPCDGLGMCPRYCIG